MIFQCVRSIVPRSTFYKRIVSHAFSAKEALQRRLAAKGTIAVHWLDNFARTFARQGTYLYFVYLSRYLS